MFQVKLFMIPPTAGTCTSRTVDSPDYSHSKASSVWKNVAIGHRWGTGRLDSTQAWSAGRNVAGEWWEMDLGAVQEVGGVVTQGRVDRWQNVKSYKVQTSQDGSSWNYVDGGKVFIGNTAPNDGKVENVFTSPVKARFVRIVVQTWNGHISMRSAVLLCGQGGTVDVMCSHFEDYN